jgi:hypothetical protein
LIPTANVPGGGQLNVPVKIEGLSCKVPSVVKPGTKIQIKGKGFDKRTKILLGNTELEITSRGATVLTVKVPKDIPMGGRVTLRQGDMVAACGEVSLEK